jgi:hypothetical protein
MTAVYELTPPEPRPRLDEPAIIVRAESDRVIIQPRPGRFDGDATTALVAAINAAVAAQATVLIDLDGGPLDPADPVPLAAAHRGPSHGAAPLARLVSPGFLELAAGRQPWLLDVVGRRLSRCQAGDRRFLPVSAWHAVRAVTVSTAAVSATTTAGQRIVVYRST